MSVVAIPFATALLSEYLIAGNRNARSAASSLFTRASRCSKVSRGNLERKRHGVTVREVLSQPVDVASVKMHLRAVPPIQNNAFAELELNNARKWRTRIFTSLSSDVSTPRSRK
jgi:hypothetical protein